MNTNRLWMAGLFTATCGLLNFGCTSPSYTTSPYHPGPVIGRGLGTGVGVVGGNVAGAAVGFTEGVVRGGSGSVRHHDPCRSPLAHRNHVRWSHHSGARRHPGQCQRPARGAAPAG